MEDGRLARDDDLGIRVLRDHPDDLALLVGWLARPHVRAWWDPDEPVPTLDEVRGKYGARTGSGSATTPCVIELAGRPIGYLQFYPWLAYPEEVREIGIPARPASYGLDLFIGEPELIDAGLGTRVVRLACRFLAAERDADDVMLTTEVGNLRAQRAYEKAGFERVREVLDLDTRDGERARCWLMRWAPPTSA